MTDLTWTPVKIRLGQIVPWSDNPRMSTKVQAQRLIKSERELGQIQTVAVSPFDEGKVYLYDGHQRVSAWLTVKDPSFEVMALQSNRMLNDDERRKVSVLLHTATGSWNWDSLSSWSAADLREWGMDGDTLKGWNNDANNLKELLNADEAEPVDAEPQIDRAAELQEKWHTATGQLWKLGEHRLLIGDCTVRENVERLMSGERAELVVTDPPYGIEYSSSTLDTQKIEGDDKPITDFIFWINETDCPFYIFCDYKSYPLVYLYCEDKGKKINDVIVWDKTEGLDRVQVPPMALMRWIRSHEFIAFHGKMAENHGYSADVLHYARIYGKTSKENQDEFIKNAIEKLSLIHPTIKPLFIIEKLIKAHDINLIVDYFAGSGTTIIAAHNLNRRCYAMEISPNYGGVILERYFTATGITPELVD